MNLSWHVEGAQHYTLRSEPPLPGLPLRTTQPRASIQVEGNRNPYPANYQLILEADSSQGIKRLSTFIRVDGSLDCKTKTRP
ncbi:MAG: peptidase S8 and S53 subtilisin kexin sedolisin, partial [Meiothermus ruber]|nr:peptidase S8 and S53 subtilisin kexin sedolisin [Meiothermus ruber]